IEDATLPAAPAPLSPDYVPTSLDYTLNSDSNSKPLKVDPKEADSEESSEEDPSEDDSLDKDLMEIPLHHPYRTLPNGVCMMRTPGKMIRPPLTPPPFIEVAITEDIAAPPHEKYKSPSPSSAPSSPPS
ncbi:hypothetical protein Tco_0899183, partial [Tanacetum coccineum]